MKNDSRKARREAERAAAAARETAGLAPGAPAPLQGEPATEAAPAVAAAPVPAPETPTARKTPTETTDAARPADGTPATPDSKDPATPSSTHGTHSKRRKSRTRVAGVLGSIGVLCLGAGAITAGSVFAPASAGPGPEVAMTSLPAGDSLASCPSTMKLFTGAGTGVDPEFEPASKDAKTSVRAAVLSDSSGRIPGTEMLKTDGSVEKSIAPRLSAKEAQESKGAGQDGTSERKGALSPAIGYAEALTTHAQPLGGVKSQVAAVRSYKATDGDLAGLAIAGCPAPAAETWLTGALTTPGSTAVLNLVNTSASVAQVRIDLRGAEGPVEAANLHGLAVAPGESKSIVLAGYAPDEKALSAKVTSSGGRVNATIQQSTLRGLVPGGVDYLGAGTSSDKTQVIPGVSILDPKLAAELAKPGANAEAVAQLVFAATSSEGATVKVRALGPEGEVQIPGGGDIVVASNATATMSLAGLPAGNYTFVIEADSAVSASAKMVRGTKADEPMDQAWVAAASRLGSEHLMVLPAQGNTNVVLSAPGDSATVSVRSLGSDGKLSAARDVELSDSRSVVLSKTDFGDGAAALVLSATGAPAYAAAVVTEGAYGIGSLGLSDAPAGREGVQVVLRD